MFRSYLALLVCLPTLCLLFLGHAAIIPPTGSRVHRTFPRTLLMSCWSRRSLNQICLLLLRRLLSRLQFLRLLLRSFPRSTRWLKMLSRTWSGICRRRDRVESLVLRTVTATGQPDQNLMTFLPFFGGFLPVYLCQDLPLLTMVVRRLCSWCVWRSPFIIFRS